MEVLIILIVLTFVMVFAYCTQRWSAKMSKNTTTTVIKYDPVYTKDPDGIMQGNVIHREDSDLANLENKTDIE